MEQSLFPDFVCIEHERRRNRGWDEVSIYVSVLDVSVFVQRFGVEEVSSLVRSNGLQLILDELDLERLTLSSRVSLFLANDLSVE